MKKFAFLSLILTLALSSTSYCFAADTSNTHPTITIGILVPAEVPAMKEIIAGYQNELNNKYPGKINYIIKNAQGDLNIQRSIIQQFQAQNVDLIAPIGTSASQMTLSLIRNKPIVAIAAELTQDQIKQSNNPNVTAIVDEVSSDKQLQFIRSALPRLIMLTLIHSSDDKSMKEVNEAKAAAPKYGIKIQDLMITQLPDLYSISQQINPQSQAIFILKDEIIVSGLNTLIQQALKKHTPLISSDDGSVQGGAAFSLGVSEKQIGIDSADITNKILNGVKAGSIPVFMMQKYTVFVNPQAATNQGADPNAVIKAAGLYGYEVKQF